MRDELVITLRLTFPPQWNLPQQLVDLQKKMDEEAKRAERGER